ncbi:glycoside hydrolase family 31 protein [Thermoplasma volcanium]|nr:glycoside hydrolase family 31 protein [Thermoplasma volcanium]
MQLLEEIDGFLKTFGDGMLKDRISYSLTRDRYDSIYYKKLNMKKIGRFLSAEKSNKYVYFHFENYDLKVEARGDGVFKFSWTDGPKLPVENIEFDDLQLHDNTVSVGNYSISLDENGLYLKDQDGKLIYQGYIPDFNEVLSQSLRIFGDDLFSGLGEKAGPINLRGHVYRLWNHDAKGSYGPDSDPLYLNIPVLLHLHDDVSYLIFFENAGDATVDIGFSREDKVTFYFKSKPMVYYVITGDIKSIYSKFSEITGKPYRPPYWAFGFQQSRYSYMSSAEVRSIVDRFNELGIPLSAIYLDIDYMDEFKVFTFNSDRFWDVKDLTKYLGERGVRLITIMEPNVKMEPGYTIYDEAVKNGYFIKYPDGNIFYAPVWPLMAAFPDFSRNDVREWWGKKYDFMKKNGVSGFWHDMNEPAIFVAWGDNSMALSAAQSNGSHSEVHNLFGYYMDKAAYDHLSKTERPFILSRSGWAGISRYAWIWTGDTETSWKEMKQNLLTILHMSASGISLTGCDIGGFVGSPDAELFIRWLQSAIFYPLFRVHSNKKSKRREPWEFGEKYLGIIRDIIKLRHSFLPQIYSEAISSSITGIPMIRPVYWYSSNPDMLLVDDEYLFGDSILVAPIFSEHSTSRIVKLPPGLWYNLYSDEKVFGEIKVEAPLNMIPIYIRSGSIIARDEGKLILHVFHSEEGESAKIYIDAGGEDSELDISVSKDGKINIHRGSSIKAVTIKFHGVYVKGITINGNTKYIEDNLFEIEEGVNELQLIFQ